MLHRLATMDDDTDALERIRAQIRGTCVFDQKGWDDSWNNVLLDGNNVRRGLILPEDFFDILGLNDVRLSRKAQKLLLAQFQAPNGGVYAQKFLNWVDLSRPKDHIDPELLFVALPQPYRRIFKVLERDILDVAWEKIKHTSSRYKAEAASTSARLTRSLSKDDNDISHNDFEAAKKRCCRSYQVAMAPSEYTVVATTTHMEAPFVVMALHSNANTTNDAQRAGLQLVETTQMTTLAEWWCDTAQPPTQSAVFKQRSIEALTALIAVPTVDEHAFVVAARMVETTRSTAVGGGDKVTQQGLVHVFHVAKAVHDSAAAGADGAAEGQPTHEWCFTHIALIRFQDVNETIRSFTIAPNASHVAVTNSKGEVAVYALPPVSTSPGTDTAAVDLNSTASVMRMAVPDSHTFPIHVRFLVRRPDIKHAPQCHDLVVACGATVAKYVLPPKLSASPPPPGTMTPPVRAWSHLTPISCAILDVSTQNLYVGCQDGSVALWDLFEDIDRLFVAPEPGMGMVDGIVHFQDTHLAIMSSTSGHLALYEIKQRTPVLLRLVMAPAASSRDTSSPIKLQRLAAWTQSACDLPLVLAAFSNGYVYVYDLRNGEAVGTLKYFDPVSKVTNPTVGTAIANLQGVFVSAHGTSVLLYYTWLQLLSALFPAFGDKATQHGLAHDTMAFKRLFLSNFALALPPPPSALNLSMGNATMDAILHATAGKHAPKKHDQPSSALPISSHSKVTTNYGGTTDSLPSKSTTVTSAGTPHSASLVGASPLEPANQLPWPHDIIEFAYKPSMMEDYEAFCHHELGKPVADKEPRLHRRRHELLKALAASW
ncbi:TPA: hypothetical protein N0F65_008382 [Lagenidium giganteum]|uniref:Uncharacterized protein n=1 Tax=Lagenidium giganteum TaxID=4803 RepID=A0AAV2YWQ7_9STRA|nr:TPA: hypothetical protein N0F65_008382 [Lagenidium giganteum]